MRADSVNQTFDRARKKAGIDDLRFHHLRHEATSRLAEKLQWHELARVTGEPRHAHGDALLPPPSGGFSAEIGMRFLALRRAFCALG